MKATGQRDNSLDTLKLVLIFFVVYGHVVEEFGTDGTLGTIRAMIYCFHMPVFVFLSGYFSKEVNPRGILESFLLPFLLFNTVFSLMIGNLHFLTPKYLYWYLLSLFFWRLLLTTISEPQKAFIPCLLLGLYVGFLSEADRFLAISRTICFFPFFIAGVMVTERTLNRIREIPSIIAWICILIVEAVVIAMDTLRFMPAKIYEHIEGYASTFDRIGYSPIYMGGVLRLVAYAIGFIMIVLVLSLTKKGKQESCFSVWGRRTISILVFSGFFVKGLFMAIQLIGANYKSLQWYIVVPIAVPISIFVTLICGNKLVYSLYMAIMKRFGMALVRGR